MLKSLADGTLTCHFEVRGSYRPFTGLTREAAEELVDDDHSLFGCAINFVFHPPAHDGTIPGTTGCHWFVNDYCKGRSVDDFVFELSSNTDINGNRVCAMYPGDNPEFPQEHRDCLPLLFGGDDSYPI